MPIHRFDIRRFNADQFGMEATQVVALIAVGSVVLLSAVQLGRRSENWANRSVDRLSSSQLHISQSAELGPGKSAPAGRVKISSQTQTFAAARHVTEPIRFETNLMGSRAGTSTSTQLAAATPTAGGLSKRQNRNRSTQQFNEDEHRLAGDLAATRARVPRVRLARDLHVTVGDMNAMGDYFESPQQIRDFASRPGRGAGTREEIEYIRAVKIAGHKNLESTFSQSAKDAVEARHLKLATNNDNHFTTPQERFAHLPPHRRPNSAGKKYRRHHIRALGFAIWAGREGEPFPNSALAEEAFGGHFLTDAISSGHVRTPRTDIKEWWDARDPGLDDRFRRFLAAKISEQVLNNGRFVRLIPGTVLGEAKRSVNAALDGKPPLTMGTLVSLALHDFDNDQGLEVVVDGSRLRVAGDGFLKSRQTSQRDKNATVTLTSEAVEAGFDELRRAYKLARRHPHVSGSTIVDQLRGKSDRFAPERFIPAEDKSQATNMPNWQVTSVDDLLKDPQMMAAMETVVVKKIRVLEELAEGLDGRARKAILDPNFGVVAQLRANPRKAIEDILKYDGALEAKLLNNGISDGFPSI